MIRSCGWAKIGSSQEAGVCYKGPPSKGLVLYATDTETVGTTVAGINAGTTAVVTSVEAHDEAIAVPY